MFHFECQTLCVIEKLKYDHVLKNLCFQLLRMEDRGLNVVVLSELAI